MTPARDDSTETTPRADLVREFNEGLQKDGKLPECPRCGTQIEVFTDGTDYVTQCPGCGFSPTSEEIDYGY